ncbi:IS30 family transposase [bacterium]|nr:IS30 family transposase [bacterium]
MQRVRWVRLSWSQKAELWQRWRRGESLSEIARALDRVRSGVVAMVAAHGGRAPAPRRRSRLALTTSEREDISRGVAQGVSMRAIGRQLGRAPSTISRELARTGGRQHYRAALADRQAWGRSRRPKSCRLSTRPRLRALVAAKLAARWSPQQIAGWLRDTFPSDPEMQVSHETIYLSLYVQSRGVLKRALLTHLRRGRRFRHSRQATRRGHLGIVDPVSIRARPPEVEDRAVPGHWEGDLLAGARNSYVATLVERQSRYLMLVRVRGKDTTSVVRALTRRVRRLPHGLMASLTWDRGSELAAHRAFTIATEVQVYFCDPQSPWQRGSNENTNGLLRQYFPDGTDLSRYSQAQLDAVAKQLNTRPRKTLGYKTPATKLAQIVALTG